MLGVVVQVPSYTLGHAFLSGLVPFVQVTPGVLLQSNPPRLKHGMLLLLSNGSL